MSFLNRLERRFGEWVIPQFPLFIVAATGVIYLLSQAQGDFVTHLTLNPDAVRQGEFWRLVTFLFVPPPMGPLWLAFWLYLLYQYAQALEHAWGAFRFFVFFGIGVAATIVAALAVGRTLSNMPLYTTLFLAFAALFPNFELLLFFILPVKVKYLAWMIWAGLAWSLWAGNLVTRVAIAASLLNYSLFFGAHHWDTLRLKVQVYRNRKRFKS